MSNLVSIIVPFHRGLDYLERCLAALMPLPAGSELLVAADGAVDDCRAVAARYGARVLDLPGPRGPAVARNRAAAVAAGDILIFVDADVVASPEAIARMASTFEQHPEIAAVFGAYDDTPMASGFVSQYKNLAHSFIHRSAKSIAQTFWAGFGAVRREAFVAVGGFDERFERPCVEDIDLGYRLTGADYRVLLDPSLTACHLKRWTLWSMVRSDVLDRGIPWTQLILRYGRFGGDLNLRSRYRVSVIAAYLAVASTILGTVDLRFLAATPCLVGLLLYLSRNYYRFFWEKRGPWFTAGVFPLHFVYHLYNGFSFTVGIGLFLVARRFGVRLPGSLPVDAYNTAPASSPMLSPDVQVKVSSHATLTPGA